MSASDRVSGNEGREADAQFIDDLADRFEAAYRCGDHPDIRQFVADIRDEIMRQAALKELIHLDVQYRLTRGESPDMKDYGEWDNELDIGVIQGIVRDAEAAFVASKGQLHHHPPLVLQHQKVVPLRCPHCYQLLRVLDDRTESVLCTNCGSSITVRNACVSTLQTSHRFGKFEFLHLVGRGAFGEVWRAKDLQLGRVVAIKIPHGGVLSSPGDLERFQREARIAAQLRHPGIVTIHEIADVQGIPAIVSDFVTGVPLQERLEAGLFSYQETARIVAEIAEAVAYAHSMGAIHRDLKPSNIMLERVSASSDGERQQREMRSDQVALFKPKVMDFGLALQHGAEITMTIEGQIVGTPAYMSPEQAAGQGHRADARSDIYSLGVILYQMLSGQLPFRGSKLMLLDQVLHEQPHPPRKFSDKIPRDLEIICLKAMNKSPPRRYQSASELSDDLRRWLRGEAIQARPVGRVEKGILWCRRYPVVSSLTALIFLLLLSVAGILLAANHRILREKALVESQTKFATESLVHALLIARPEAVPGIIDKLKTLAHISRPALHRVLQDRHAPLEHHVRAASALSAIGQVYKDVLLKGIPTSSAEECANIARALQPVQDSIIPRLVSDLAEGDAGTRSRMAGILWYLNSVEGVEQILSLTADRTQRTEFIHSFSAWCWNPAQLPNLLPRIKSPDARSGMCLAIAALDSKSISTATREQIATQLTHWFTHDPDGAVHSAAAWALQHWEQPLPEIPANPNPSADQNWYLSRSGMTLLRVSPGEYAPSVRILPGFFMSDREVSIELFAKFVRDPNYSSSEKPEDYQLWRESVQQGERANGIWGVDVAGDPSTMRPLVGVNIFDVMQFCNWLSVQDGREPCYRPAGESWHITHGSGEGRFSVPGWFCDFDKTGYRLPTIWEWRIAAGAHSFPYHFGTNSERLASYAWFKMNSEGRLHRCGQLLPSPWGFFDVFGNATEYCWERDPTTGWFSLGGGDWNNDHQECSLATLYQAEVTHRANSRGFRVVCRDVDSQPKFDAWLQERENRVREQPDSIEFKLGLADTYEELGTRAREAGNFNEAVQSYGKALTNLQPVVVASKANPDLQQHVLEPYELRARLFEELQRPAEALRDWLVILDVQQPTSDATIGWLLSAVRAVALEGHHELAAEAAHALARTTGNNSTRLYHTACVYSWCMDAVSLDTSKSAAELMEVRQRYFVQAMQSLESAVENGLSNVSALKSDPDLEALRSTSEFQELLSRVDEGA